MTNPDFKTWAENVLWKTRRENLRAVEEALEQAFKQGYQLGLNKGWAYEQDRALVYNAGYEHAVNNMHGKKPECGE